MRIYDKYIGEGVMAGLNFYYRRASLCFDTIANTLVFVGVVVVVGFCFLANSPQLYLFKYEWLEVVFKPPVYIFIFSLLVFFLVPWFDLVALSHRPLFWWLIFFLLINIYHLLDRRDRVDFNFIYLILFLSPMMLVRREKPLVFALLVAIGFNAVYGVLGMISARRYFAYDVFPVVPYVMNGIESIGVGFYRDFSAALYCQTNAAGAIYAASFTFFLYRFLANEFCKKCSIAGLVFSGVGLVCSRALAPLLLTTIVALWCMPSRLRRLLLGVMLIYVSFILFTRDGILGVNVEYMRHKVDTSASIKLSLFEENLRLLVARPIGQMMLPGVPNNWGTENSFVDAAFQYGLLSVLLFYGYCVKTLMQGKGGRTGFLLLTPLVLSLMQNSALTPPSMIILGISLGRYGKSESDG